MKELLKGIWEGPSTTVAAGAVAAAAIIAEHSDALDLPTWAIVALTAVASFLAVYKQPK